MPSKLMLSFNAMKMSEAHIFIAAIKCIKVQRVNLTNNDTYFSKIHGWPGGGGKPLVTL